MLSLGSSSIAFETTHSLKQLQLWVVRMYTSLVGIQAKNLVSPLLPKSTVTVLLELQVRCRVLLCASPVTLPQGGVTDSKESVGCVGSGNCLALCVLGDTTGIFLPGNRRQGFCLQVGGDSFTCTEYPPLGSAGMRCLGFTRSRCWQVSLPYRSRLCWLMALTNPFVPRLPIVVVR